MESHSSSGKSLGFPSIYRLACVALISLSFVVFLGKAYETSLRGIDSNIHAKASMSVTSGGIAPKLPISDFNSSHRSGGKYFNDHPFFYFWMNGWVMRALGPSAWSARVLTASFSTGCVILVLLLGSLVHSKLYGMISALFLLFTRDIILTGATVSLDPAMLFFILLSYYLWWREKWILVGVTTGIGLWIKTPVVLLIFPVSFIYSLIQGRIKEQLPKIATAFIIALFIGSWIWITTGILGGWPLVGDYWLRQLWGTAVHGRNIGQNLDEFMFFRMVKNGFLPGLPFLLWGLFEILRKRKWKQPFVIATLLSIFVLIMAITPIRFKMDYYFNPAFPFLSFLAAHAVIDLLTPLKERFYSTVVGFSLILMAFLLSSPTSLGPEGFVALKRFAPIIQTYGSCNDHILLIPGGEPVGSALDYQLALDFYTGRVVEVATCEAVGAGIQRGNHSWVIVSRENYDKCLTPEEKEKFETRYVVGNQYLLTNLIPEGNTIDLTPLERELKPVVDCQAQPYPQDIYHRY